MRSLQLSAAGKRNLVIPPKMKISNGVGYMPVPNGGSEGASLSTDYLGVNSGGNVWNNTALGWRITSSFYQQFAETYNNECYLGGASLTFKLKKLPVSGNFTFGAGMSYGNILPNVSINSAGVVAWGSGAHSAAIAGTATVNDTFYISGVMGKYDFLWCRGTTKIASDVNFYTGLDQYTLGGSVGLASTTGTSQADAGCISDLLIIAKF